MRGPPVVEMGGPPLMATSMRRYLLVFALNQKCILYQSPNYTISLVCKVKILNVINLVTSSMKECHVSTICKKHGIPKVIHPKYLKNSNQSDNILVQGRLGRHISTADFCDFGTVSYFSGCFFMFSWTEKFINIKVRK